MGSPDTLAAVEQVGLLVQLPGRICRSGSSRLFRNGRNRRLCYLNNAGLSSLNFNLIVFSVYCNYILHGVFLPIQWFESAIC